MSNEAGQGGFYFPVVYQQDQISGISGLKNGEFDHIALSAWTFADEFLCFGLQSNLFQFLDQTYPNPRKQNEVPVWFLMACQSIPFAYLSIWKV